MEPKCGLFDPGALGVKTLCLAALTNNCDQLGIGLILPLVGLLYHVNPLDFNTFSLCVTFLCLCESPPALESLLSSCYLSYLRSFKKHQIQAPEKLHIPPDIYTVDGYSASFFFFFLLQQAASALVKDVGAL